MSDLRKAAEMALEVLMQKGEHHPKVYQVAEALRQALAQPEQKRELVGLTDEDLEPMCDDWRIVLGPYVHDFSKAIEAKLKEKNT